MTPWKQFEAEAAALFGGKRFWANSGERLDFASDTAVGQCKLVKSLSLSQLTALAEEIHHEAEKNTPSKAGVVCVKLRRGRGSLSLPLVVMTFAQFKKFQHKEEQELEYAKPNRTENV